MDTAFNQTAYALLPISLIGFLVNWLVFFSFIHLNSMKHSFGYLSASQSLADAIHSTAFLFYFCPMILLDQPTMKALSGHCGFVVIVVYELSIFSHFAVSINRFCAVWIPFKFPRIFNKTNTFFIIFLIWIVIGSTDVLFFEYLCQAPYSERTRSFLFTATEFCGNLGWYGDFVKNSITVTIIVLLDIAALFGARLARLSSNISSNAHNRNIKKERRFLKQTVLQGSIFMFELLTYFFTPQLTNNIVVIFFGTSFAYVAVHVLDGIIVIWCNPEVRRFLLCRKDLGKVSASNRS
ncbi:unnamed protein product [Caenorhabditis brenneri]